MNAFVVVVVDVFVEESLQMTLVDHDDMIEKISLDGAHPASLARPAPFARATDSPSRVAE
jgi:hypothetical protein